MIEGLFFSGGLIVGALIIWLVLRNQHQLIVQSLENEANLKLTALSEKLQNEQQHNSEKNRLIEESKAAMQAKFENLVNKLFHENTQKSNQNLNLMLKPLKEQLSSFSTRVNEVYNEETKQRSSLLTEIKNLKELNNQISQDAINLTKALKGENKTQGDWGEMILETILEQSGLRKDKEYTIQGSFVDENGKRVRPDVILHLPEKKDIVIDSKVSLNAYVQYVNCEEKSEKELAQKELEKSFLAHIKNLSAKRYENIKALRSLDFVLMFVPIEGAFLLAASHNGNLFKTAFDNNIMIVSPSTLFVTLRTIENIWKFEYQNENAQHIALKAANLYDKFALFLESFQKVGKGIENAQDAYDTAFNRLSSGKGNVVSRIEEFKDMGVKPNKQISQNMFGRVSMELLIEFSNNFLKLLDAMSIYVMVGLLIAGVLKQIIPDDFVSSHLGKDSTASVVKATLFGIPLPVCSCSVIPLAQGLKKEGASKGAVQSFLISTPITGVDSILATFSFFGLVFTVFRVLSSVVIAIVVGLLQNFIENKEVSSTQIKEKERFKPTFSSSDVYTNGFSVQAPQKQQEKSSSCGCSSSTSSCCTTKSKKSFSFINALKYGYGTLFSDMAKSLLIGLILGAAFTTFMPQEYAKLLFDNQILTYFVILIVAMPLYTCATASLPIAAALMLQGMSAGAAFIFLTAGPATSAVTMSVIYKMLGRTSLLVYTITIAVMALIFGFMFDTFLGDLSVLNISSEDEKSSLIYSVASLLMLILIVYHLFKEKFTQKRSSCCS